MSDIEICRWTAVSERERVADAVEAVFFESSAVRSFASTGARAAFHERWLGRYLLHFPEHVLIAMAGPEVAGYLVGSLDDPANDPLFDDLAFLPAFSGLTRRYPAHLHVNLAAPWRGQGIGARLISAFAERARASGAPGVHVVTQRGLRNVGFYEHNAFLARGSTVLDGRELLFLGRDL